MSTPTHTRSGARRREAVASERRSVPETRARRRIPVAALLVALILAGGIAAGIGPYLDYRAVERERKAMEAEVALLEQENVSVQEQIDRLSNDAYLEALARSELNLARPGEDVFIVTGTESMPETTEPSEEAPEPGSLEKMLSSLRNLF